MLRATTFNKALETLVDALYAERIRDQGTWAIVFSQSSHIHGNFVRIFG